MSESMNLTNIVYKIGITGGGLAIALLLVTKSMARRHYMRMHHCGSPVAIAGLDGFDHFHMMMGAAVQVIAIVVAKCLQH